MVSGGPFPWYFYRDQWTSYSAPPKGDHLKGQTVILTGANSGIGLEALNQLAAFAPSVLILAVRTISTGEKAAQAIRAKYPKIKVEVWELDLARLGSVKAFAEKAKSLDRLDLLMNNAGINPNFDAKPAVMTEDGYERTVQTNVISQLVLSLALLPLLGQSPNPKIVFTTSDTHAIADPTPIDQALRDGERILGRFSDKNRYDNGTRYFQSKLLLQMTTRKLISALPNVSVISANPGLCRTNLGREFDMSFSFKLIGDVIWFLANSRSAKKGAWNLTGAAVSKTGSHDYWSEGGPKPSESKYMISQQGIKAADQWWDEIKSEAEKILPGSTAALTA